MKKLIFALAVAAASLATPVFAADVGVSINVGEPGFFGRIDIGGLPAPRLLAPRPVLIERGPPGVVVEPYYLNVPPEHRRNWRRYCARYNACGHPVYFVDHSWYNDVYVPRYHEHHMQEQRLREERMHEERQHEERRDEHVREERHEEHRRDERHEEHHDDRHDDHHDDHDHDHDHDHH